ncbi:MAG: YbaB/EbfC family nucleoid-associated protein [Gammaproteobacteria bacterium]|jgi:DNA-binding YbaB/EbfC family protein|nr:YbaB/EbfC family nucleoid-associated protein [Gammaproteobacteria bacterium]MDB3909709.1 YbaB/EbfC family nucleoid-associated protein [Gammaproteobacteria bacterium]MDC0414374.1 YbaB/EbfC family nucleoid-associated protein [Gammaproteobacteria bacterium]
MTDLNEIMKQAKLMQEQFQKAQEEQLKTMTEGESGAGLVKVVMNGKHDVISVSMDDGVMGEDKAVIEDLLAAAVNDAVRKIEEKNKDALGSMAGGMKMPDGFKFPF